MSNKLQYSELYLGKVLQILGVAGELPASLCQTETACEDWIAKFTRYNLYQSDIGLRLILPT